jgi:hypothetical protein
MPDDLRMAAEASDAEVAMNLAGLIPTPDKPYSPKVVTALAQAIAAAAKIMGLDLKPSPYTEPVAELEPDMVRFLAMMDAAAKDYGSPLPIALDAIKGDRELTVITAALMQLAKDRDFKDFLNMPIEEEEGPETEVEVKVKPGMKEEDEEEYDFASRMR